jgi:hypothetical protein
VRGREWDKAYRDLEIMMTDWSKGNIYILYTPEQIQHILMLQMNYSLHIFQLFYGSTGIWFLLNLALCMVLLHQDFKLSKAYSDIATGFSAAAARMRTYG